ncbi:MAG: flavodoxin [Candidatus Marinimicrobia bacterium]|nr:flavodoxin [Candidatus Neomarinimicrobiota bacterium]|tara:strand:+ start:498 stop:1013 length:516 start_codon:yes stop_codon:yes gene_type:complete
MEVIGMFWGSNTGNQEEASGFLKDYMISEGFKIDEYNIVDTKPDKMLDYKILIIGCPTWHIGELQDDWDTIYEEYKSLDFSGIKAAFFGCGDQVGYPDNFLDAIGLLAKPFMNNGGLLIGRWPAEGYEFDNSLALDGDEFLGLGLDNDNEEELTEERLIIWAELIRDEFNP